MLGGRSQPGGGARVLPLRPPKHALVVDLLERATSAGSTRAAVRSPTGIFNGKNGLIYNMALVAYRNLLRSARIAFQGDMNTLFAARAEARKIFESNRNLRIGSEELEKSLVHAEEVAKFLRENVVQGQAADTEGNYKLRIHEYTERGDNEDIKKGKGKSTLGGTKCCSS
ncbi:Mitochondrial zinc maintenance 1 mitochondrial [Pyrenophora seminiperda CCB06]|uniref:Mitochondrial zinc maintenance protein 1, mitochondrial n=1 Tax=Pyrenophora seminiperda CCB06 TaxID=1302712 RepID=A0A3M7MAK5_9PLEO|nr:Mitochondrial zinc maintenance 1 mitochondrial [Pyrenophora seminiperda CCB06]